MTTKHDVVSSLQDLHARFEKFCSTYNHTQDLDKRSWEVQMGRLDMAISSGEEFAKASSIYCDLTVETPPVLAEKIGQKGSKADALVLEMNLFPVNPFVCKGYIELRANITDKIVFAGGTDIFPYFDTQDTQDDHEFFAEEMKKLCARHGQDYAAMRKTRADFFKSKYTNEKVGSHAGIYSFHIAEQAYPFFKDMGETFFNAYSEIFERRKDKSFTEQDKQHQLKLHGKWAQWILLEDEGTKFGLDKGIPPEALLGAVLPPTATF